MNKIALALMGAAALSFGSAASATVTVTGATIGTTFTGLVGGADTGPVIGASFGYSQSNIVPPTFEEIVNFTNDLFGSYLMSVTNLSPGMSFTGATLTGGVLPAGGISLTLVDAGLLRLYATTLNPGDYTLDIVGNNNSGGSLSGTVNISPVPEPSTWALMLLGFGGMGFAMRRGRKRLGLAQLA